MGVVFLLAPALAAVSLAQDDDYLERLRALQEQVAAAERGAQQVCLQRQEEAAQAWPMVEQLHATERPEGLAALGEFVDRYSAPLVVDGQPVDCPVESLSMARALEGSTSFLAVDSLPSGAAVLVDGLPMGRTPFVSNRLPEGKHVLRLELEGYRAETRLVEILAGSIVQLGEIPLDVEAAPKAQEP